MFDRLKEIRLKAGALEAHMTVLLQSTQQEAAMGTRVRAAPPPEPAPPPPSARAPRAYVPPRPMGTTADYNAHHDFQNPAPPTAPRLPPPAPKPEENPVAKVFGYIEDLRAAAIHLHNTAGLLMAISNVLEHVMTQQMNAMRPPLSPPPRRR